MGKSRKESTPQKAGEPAKSAKPPAPGPAKATGPKSGVVKGGSAKSSDKGGSVKGGGAHASHSTPKLTAKPAPMGSINTNLAAASAARLLAAGLSARKLNQGAGNSSAPESASFKQLKSGSSRPADQGAAGVLDKINPPKHQGHGGGPAGGPGQRPHTGSDATRINVPRRTAG